MIVKAKLRLAVLEDDPPVRALIRRVLEKEYTVVLVQDGNDLCDLVQKGAVHLIVLDIGLPGEDGITIAKRIRSMSAVPVLFVSGNTAEETIITGLNVGGDDYVTKPFSPAILLARVRNALRRAAKPATVTDMSAGELPLGSCVLDSAHRQLRGAQGQLSALTETESVLLATLAKTAPDTVSREDLSRALYGQDWNPLNRSLDVHLSHVRRKLALVAGDAVKINCIRGVGYCLKLEA